MDQLDDLEEPRVEPVASGHESSALLKRREDDTRDTTAPARTSRVQAPWHLNETEQLREKVKRLEARVSQLDELVHLDPLLNVLNRRGFFNELEKLIDRADRYGGSAAMIFADVDGLKQINDQFGHQAGDEALVKIAETLVASVRSSDSVARLAGDEFAVLLPEADEMSAWRMALRIFQATVASPLIIEGNPIRLSVAVGACAVRAGDQPQAVVSRADAAMYRIKVSPLLNTGYQVNQMPRFGELLNAIDMADRELWRTRDEAARKS